MFICSYFLYNCFTYCYLLSQFFTLFLLSLGSFTCTCNPGYSGSGFACSDNDECASSPCDEHATCTNEPGGFACSCESGYSGDGVTCTDIDECASSPCNMNASCTNLSGCLFYFNFLLRFICIYLLYYLQIVLFTVLYYFIYHLRKFHLYMQPRIRWFRVRMCRY